MQDIKAFANVMRLVFDYCSCSSGGRVVEMKELLPTITEALNLRNNTEWHKFCSERDRKNVNNYTDVSIINRIKQDGNYLATLPDEYITWSRVHIALNAVYPLTISNILKNKTIHRLFTNERIAKQMLLFDLKKVVYNIASAKKPDKMLNPYYYRLWHKDGTSFEKIFKAPTLKEQLELICPIEVLLADHGESLNANWNKLKSLNIKGNFNVVIAKMVNYIARFRTINDPGNPWSDKKSVLLVEDEKENDFFWAYIKAAHIEMPRWDRSTSVPYHIYLARCLKVLQECLLMKYN